MAILLSGNAPLGYPVCTLLQVLVVFSVLYRSIGGLGIAVVRLALLYYVSRTLYRKSKKRSASEAILKMLET